MSAWLKIYASLLLFSVLQANASSRITGPKTQQSEAYCELTGYFKNEATTERSSRQASKPAVVWLYEIISVKKSSKNSTCPSTTELFELSIPSGEYAPENEARYIYPDFIDVPKPGTKQSLRVRRIHVVNPINKENYVHWINL